MMFSARLRKLREDRGYTLRKLAADAGISNPHLSQLERGHTTPSAAVLERLADALGFTMHELWKGVGRCDPSEAEPPSVLVQEIASLLPGEGDACPRCDGTLFALPFGAIGLRCTKCDYASAGGQG